MGMKAKIAFLYYGLMLCRSWCYPAELACNESCFGEVDQDDMFMLQSKSMSELMSSSLTGIKTAECLFGEKAKFFVHSVIRVMSSPALLALANDL